MSGLPSADALSLERLAAQVVVPLLDLRPGAAPDTGWERAEALRGLGAGGFILFGGEREALAARLPAFKAGAEIAPLIGADLERGVGQQVDGCRDLPPLLALGASDDEALVERSGAEVAREALALGIDWLLAPVLDLADEPRNPIVGTRAFGAEPARVAALGAAFVRGVQGAGALACAKHFPGHGGTTGDSHAELPAVAHARERLEARDLAPFRAAVAAGMASVMTAHVTYPALAPGGLPATFDPRLVDGLLRADLGHAGLVVTDALIMDGARQGVSELEGAVRALEAGCDLLLFPREPERLIEGLAAWAGDDPARAARLRAAVGRVLAAKARLAASSAQASSAQSSSAQARGGGPAADLAREVAERALTRVGSARAPLAAGQHVAFVVLDDDPDLSAGLAGELSAGLVAGGVVLHPVALAGEEPSADARALADLVAGDLPLLAVVGCRVRAWKGRPGLAPALGEALRALPGERLTVVGLCGPVPLLPALPAGAGALLAYGDEPVAQRAVAAALLRDGGASAPGRLPVASS